MRGFSIWIEITSFLWSKTSASDVVTSAVNSFFQVCDFTLTAPAKLQNFRTAAWRLRISFARFAGSSYSGVPFTLTRILICGPYDNSLP